ncbi:MAG: N-acetyltransferase [Alphaproteobacteria bacterium]|nr:N-acetyltransferase [Alphaproteobacteria bacterium]
MWSIRQEQPGDAPYIEPLVDRAFGPDRFKKTVYKLRAGVPHVASLAFVADEGGTIIASLRFWPAKIADREVLILGPLSVEPERHGQGLGKALMRHGLKAAAEQGHKAIILVGDPEYYEGFGFTRGLALGLTLPGPVEERRFLGVELVKGSLAGLTGMVERADAPPVVNDLPATTRRPTRRAKA